MTMFNYSCDLLSGCIFDIGSTGFWVKPFIKMVL